MAQKKKQTVKEDDKKQSGQTLAQNPNVKHIKGYRQLTDEELSLVNEIKTKGNEVGDLIAKLEKLTKREDGESAPDPRWLAIAKTDLQKGFMVLVRAVTKPDFF